jgi:hypothetical protein
MFRNVLVAIVAVLALSAVASATASAALPEIVNSKGEALIKKKFTGEVTERMIDEINGRGSEECQKLAFAGEVKGTKGGEGTLTLHCSGGCHTKGLKEKEMKFPVSVNLVWLSKAKEEAALLLSIPGVADFEGYCWSDTMPSQFPLEVSGSLLIRVSPTNKLGTEYRFLVKQKNGRQEPSEYENEAGEKVKAQLETTASLYWKNQSLGLEDAFPMNFEEAAEFKA